MNDDLQKELRQALARVQPPEGFTERVLDRLPALNRKKRGFQMILAIAATTVLAASLTFYRHHQEQERERIGRAQQQLTFALRLTAQKLTLVDARLKKSARQVQTGKGKEQL